MPKRECHPECAAGGGPRQSRTASLLPDADIKQRSRSRPRGAFTPEPWRHHRPRKSRGRREGRELAAPMARVRKKMHAAVTTGSAGTSRPSLRDGVTVAPRSPRGPALLPPSPVRSSKQARTWHQHRDSRTTRLGRPQVHVRPRDQITLARPRSPPLPALHVS
jgi:hypothetical protein